MKLKIFDFNCEVIMPDENIPEGFPVFLDDKEVELMSEIKKAYIESFQGDAIIEENHKKVPDAINISTHYHTKKFFIFGKYLVGYVKKQLSISDLKLKNFSDSSEVYSNRCNYELTFDLINRGISYVDQTEEDFFRRKGWNAFSSIHKPEYYLIFVISSRVKDLCRLNSSESLVKEYECLENFIEKITSLLSHYFPSRNEVEPFHHYLFDAKNFVKEMKNRSEFELSRVSIATSLEQVSNSLISYRRELAIYLAYCLSSAEIKSIGLNQLSRDYRGLPPEFYNSILYRNIKTALSGNIVSQRLNSNDYGVSQLIFNSISDEEGRKIVNCYHNLLNSLSEITNLSKNIIFLKENTELNGSYKVVHDQELHLALSINMEAIKFFLTHCREKMDYINGKNNLSLFRHENFKFGITNNIQESKAQSKKLETIEENIKRQQAHISTKIIEIEKLNSEVLKKRRADLIKNTKDVLTSMGENGTIDPVKLNELQTNLCNCGLTSTNEETYIKVSAGKNDMIEPSEKIVERKHPFASKLYAFLCSSAHKISELNKLIDSLYKEIASLDAFITKLEGINRLRIDLENNLVNSSEKSSNTELFLKLKKECDEAYYAGMKFTRFNVLDCLIDIYVNREDLLKKSVRLLLNSNLVEGNQTQKQTFTQTDELVMIVSNHALHKTSDIMNRIEVLKNSFSHNEDLYEANFVDYFSQKLGTPFSLEEGLVDQPEIPEIPSNLSEERIPDPAKPLSLFLNLKQLDTNPLMLKNICEELFNERKTVKELKDGLKKFRDFLFQFSYKLHFFGGSWVQDRKVSKHAKRAIDIYDSKITHATNLSSVKSIRDNMFKMLASQASKYSSQSCCLFSFRDNSTQDVYDIIESAMPDKERQSLLK